MVLGVPILKHFRVISIRAGLSLAALSADEL